MTSYSERLLFIRTISHIIFVMAIIPILTFIAFAGGYPGFKEINDKECAVIENNDIQRLPSSWHKYNGFIRICGLKENKTGKPKISLISVWAFDYLNFKNQDDWENFPMPIIIDNEWNHLGYFPEIYPTNLASELYVYYGKWDVDGTPKEIRIDVENPSATGDYYYAPLIWNNKARRYLMQKSEAISGKRPR